MIPVSIVANIAFDGFRDLSDFTEFIDRNGKPEIKFFLSLHISVPSTLILKKPEAPK